MHVPVALDDGQPAGRGCRLRRVVQLEPLCFLAPLLLTPPCVTPRVN